MPQTQVDFYQTLVRTSREIAKQLAIANKLKALEMKSAGRYSVTPEMIDDIIKDKN